MANNVIADQNNGLITKVIIKLDNVFNSGNCLKAIQYGKPDKSYKPGGLNTLSGSVDLPPGTQLTVYALGIDRDLTSVFRPDGTEGAASSLAAFSNEFSAQFS